MITSVRFCLSYECLNACFHENLHCCNGRRHDAKSGSYISAMSYHYPVQDNINTQNSALKSSKRILSCEGIKPAFRSKFIKHIIILKES